MKIYFDDKTKKWISSFQGDLTLGSNNLPIYPMLSHEPHFLPFEVSNKNGNLGPIIGILTSQKKDGSIGGNGEFFQQLHKEILLNKGIPLLFTLEGIQENKINGYTFMPEKERWVSIISPLPHVVYNRVPYRTIEKSLEYCNVVEYFSKQKIPFFNPSFINKYELYNHLKKHPILKNYTPNTYLVQDKEKIKQHLYNYKHLYFKPVEGSKGKGIFLVSLKENETIQLDGLKKQQFFQNYDAFWETIQQEVLQKTYIAQEKIVSATLNDNRYDFRILIHYEKGKYILTGVGVRQANKQEITTHIPNGGKLIPYSSIQTKQHDMFIQNLVNYCGDLLTKELGFFGEFSIDAGVSENGNYFIYEINSKPMIFDESEIETKRKKHLTNLFHTLW